MRCRSRRICFAESVAISVPSKTTRPLVGEGSVALADALGIWSDARHGGASDEILYLLFPGSGNRKPRMIGEIQSEGEKLVYRWGGMKELSSCLESRDPAVESGEF